MKATDILTEEHTVIERVLDALETAIQSLEGGGSIPADFFIGVTDFIKGFADGCHHKKEEDVLFRAMAAHGVPVEGGPIGAMLAEHEQGRLYTRGMREAARRLKTGDGAARADIIRNARGYVALLRQHIAKENGVLFPMADQAIPQTEHEAVAASFDRVEHEETGPGVHEKYLSLAAELEKTVAS
ncbi:MAG: hemerythrin domain-containing protein [Anaerolineae bacterium]